MRDIDNSLLVHGIAAAKAKDLQEARRYLEWFLMRDPPIEKKIEAWFWLSEISSDPAEQWHWVENILANEPGEPRARRKAALLKGQIRPGEVVDPDRILPVDRLTAQDVMAERFTCPQCGGVLVFAPDGQSLTCEYCASQRLLAGSPNAADAVQELDFFAALATAKGHRSAVKMQTFTCEGCGTNFMLPAERLTVTCPYCASNYVVNQKDVQDMIEPSAVIPFQVSEKAAKAQLRAWLKEARLPFTPKFTPGSGFYIPVWSFDICSGRTWRKDDVLVLASRRIPPPFGDIIHQFDLRQLAPYQPAYLADWLAETYQVSMGDASLLAREIAAKEMRNEFPRLAGERERALDTSKMYIDRCMLVLFPIWMTHYVHQDERCDVIINGQTGRVMAETSPA